MSPKVDFTTFAGWGSMPVASTLWTGPGGEGGVRGKIYRIGNICMVSDSFVATTPLYPQDGPVGEKIPQGFRPVGDVAIVITDATVSANSGVYRYSTDTDSASLSCHAQLGHNAAWRGALTGVWVTKDEWPSS